MTAVPRTVWLLVVLAVGAAAPAVGANEPQTEIAWDVPQTAGARLRLPADGDRGEPAARAYLEAARASLVDLGAPAAMAAADGSIEFTTPANDLDGDDAPDVLTSRYVPRSDFDPDLSLRYYRGYDYTLRARRGTNGSDLWSYADRAAALYAMPMMLTDGEGVLVAAYEVNYANGSVVYAWGYSLKLTALDRTGAKVWERTFAGPYTHVNFVGGGGAALPLLRGLLDAVPGAADDILVDSVDSFRSNRVGQHPVRVEAAVLDGATGETAARSFRTVGNADYYLEPFVIPAGDLDGDGLDDCLFVLQRSVDAPASLEAVRGSDGAELWRTEAVSFGGAISIATIGDATGDGAGDLAVSNFAAAGSPGVFLLSGRTGAIAWSGPGRGGFAAGDVSGDGLPDLGIVEFAWDGSAVSARLAAVTGTGASLHSRTHTLGGLDGAQSVSGQILFPGLVDGDEAVDIALHLAGSVDGVASSLDVLLAGADGTVARELENESPLGGSVDGDGADFLRLTSAPGGGTRVTVVDGASGKDRWITTVAAGKAVQATELWTTDLDADRGDDLIVNSMGSYGTELTILRGADASRLWTA